MRNRNVRTTLFLELTNHCETLTFEVLSLPYNASFYRFAVNSQDQPMELESRFCYAYIDWAEWVMVYNLVLDCYVSLKDLQINHFTANKVRRLMTKPHAVTINVYSQTKQLIGVITLYNDLKEDDGNAGTKSPSQHKLYPELPAYWNRRGSGLQISISVIKIALIWFAYFNFRNACFVGKPDCVRL